MENGEFAEEKDFDLKSLLSEAEVDAAKFFDCFEKEYNNEKLSSLFGYFLSNSSDYNLLKETIIRIGKHKTFENIDNLIDFLMIENQNKVSDLINLKTLCIGVIASFKTAKAIPALLYCLNDKRANYKMRFKAAEALGNIGDSKAVDSLINIVSDEEEKSLYVRESAATALGMIGDMRAVDPFLSILEAKKNILDKFTFLKERVIEALGKINFTSSKRIVLAFKNALKDDSPQVRINAIECLMNSDYDGAYDLIRTKIFDENEEVVKNAVIALYNLKGKEALFEILKDENASKFAKEMADELYAEYEE